MLDAFAILPRLMELIRLIIVGDGPLKKSLERRATIGPRGRIHFTGHLAEREKLVNLYQRASLFVLPSHHEGLPTVILEAMACGCPVLATCVGESLI